MAIPMPIKDLGFTAGLPSMQLKDGKSVIIGESAALKTVFRQLERIAKVDVPILLVGETGTGKELAARFVHYQGIRGSRKSTYLAVNALTIPPDLAESILFGHEKGSFTGATSRREGLFTQADNGTLFLDEIGELPLAVQGKLLRILEDGNVYPLGATEGTHVDVRMITATNRNLLQDVYDGRFKDDLFYRLATIPIMIPSLRERRDDIPHIATYYVRVYNNDFKTNIEGFNTAAMNLLQQYSWPGNIRELQNVLRRAVLYRQTGEVRLEDIVFDEDIFPAIRRGAEIVASDSVTPIPTAIETKANGKLPYDKYILPIPIFELAKKIDQDVNVLNHIVDANKSIIYSVAFGGEQQTRVIYLGEGNIHLFTAACEPGVREQLECELRESKFSRFCRRPHKLYNATSLMEEPESHKSIPQITKTVEENPELIVHKGARRLYFIVPTDRVTSFIPRRGDSAERTEQLIERITSQYNLEFMTPYFGVSNGHRHGH
jgi:hypothetical protein